MRLWEKIIWMGKRCAIIASSRKRLLIQKLGFVKLDISLWINLKSLISFDLKLLLIVLLIAHRISLYYPAILLNGVRLFVELDVSKWIRLINPLLVRVCEQGKQHKTAEDCNFHIDPFKRRRFYLAFFDHGSLRTYEGLGHYYLIELGLSRCIMLLIVTVLHQSPSLHQSCSINTANWKYVLIVVIIKLWLINYWKLVRILSGLAEHR